jgi:aspartate aminotransferase-like enzyme
MTTPNAPRRGAPTGYRLRLPGPTEVPERVRQAIARPVVNHRGPEFRADLAHAEALIQPVLGTKNRVLFFACTGTGAMEASIANIIAPGERLLVAVNGQFGERYAEIGRALGAQVDRIEFPWGEGVDPAAIEARVRETEYRAVIAIHNESSTGCVADLGALGAILRDRPTLLVVDSVSGLGGVEMRQDEWGVDIVVSASQKALMCPPGVGLASVGPKAWKIVNRDTAAPRFYWDFRKAAAAVEKSETSFTAPVSLIGGLGEALEMIHEEGLAAVLARHRRLSEALRAGGAALGLNDFTRSAMRSSTVVVFDVPEPLGGADIVRKIYERHQTVIAGARNRLAGRVIRIGTMGSFTAGTILTDLMQLEDVLTELGRPVRLGAGVDAALASLAASRTGAPGKK